MVNPSKKRLNISTIQQKYLLKKLNIVSLENLDTVVLKKLKEALKTVDDPRQKYKTHYKIWDIVICVIIADFANIYDWNDIHDFVSEHYSWFRTFLQMTGGVPSSQTYERVFSLIDYKQLEEILNKFYLAITYNHSNKTDTINIDGKVDKGSSRNQTDYHDKTKPLNSLNAYSNNLGICLASEIIDDKTNEIPTIPTILKRLKIKDVIITWDALNTQKENIDAVVGGKAHYVVPIKGNQGNLFSELDLYFDEKRLETIIAGNTKSAYLKYHENSHSSLITYEYFQTNDINWFHDKKEWNKLTTIGLVKKTIIKNGEVKIEKRYYISSLEINIVDFSNAIRNHWSVENKLHWHLDFTFRQDYNTTMNKNALMNLQIVNKFCLAILNKFKPFYDNKSLRRIRNIMSYNFEKNFVDLLCYLVCS